ncbi:MAG TPA: hypothetical protein VHM19_15965 [Polyangiales bacterium]|nr:hypothetical protein [Polyangiales bacterium]
MSSEPTPVDARSSLRLSDDLQRAVACARAHEQGRALGAFAYDVLGTQAEGRALFAGQKFMAQRAQTHGVDTQSAATELGNLLSILERGPSDAAEHALVAAFAARGAADALSTTQGEARVGLANKLVGELDWIELSTRYRLWPCLAELLDAPAKHAVCDALADAVLREDRSDASEAAADLEALTRRARNAARLTVLGAFPAPRAREALTRVHGSAKDPGSRALAATFLGVPTLPPSAANVLVTGHAATVTRSTWRAVLRWITGFALLHALARTLGFLLHLQREVELDLQGRVLHARRRTSLFGRTVRASEAVYPVERIRGARRAGRYALARTVVGALSLSFGVLLGGYLGFDAARGGAGMLLGAAVVLCALGVGVDLALDLLGSALRGNVRLQIDLEGARSLALRDVPVADADRFLDSLAKQLQAGGR